MSACASIARSNGALECENGDVDVELVASEAVESTAKGERPVGESAADEFVSGVWPVAGSRVSLVADSPSESSRNSVTSNSADSLML